MINPRPRVVFREKDHLNVRQSDLLRQSMISETSNVLLRTDVGCFSLCFLFPRDDAGIFICYKTCTRAPFFSLWPLPFSEGHLALRNGRIRPYADRDVA